MSSEKTEIKMKDLAHILHGRVVDDSGRVAVCIKGVVEGFPATVEAILPGWPCGVMYTIETKILNVPDAVPGAKLTIYPHMAKGLWHILGRILLIEPSGFKTGDKRLDRLFLIDFNNADIAKRFLDYPGVAETLIELYRDIKFSEMVIRTDIGICLTHPTNFNKVSLDLCRETFRRLSILGRVLSEAF